MRAAHSFLDDLLVGFVGNTPASPANPANPAKLKHPCGLRHDLRVCEGLRIPANPTGDSQLFAGLRNGPNRPQSEQRRGFSQDSQDSQASGAASAAATPDEARYLDRRDRLLRWGWPRADAEALAARLARHDRAPGDMVSCIDCRHYRPGRCGNHRRAALHSPEVGRDLAALLQRCPGFVEQRS